MQETITELENKIATLTRLMHVSTKLNSTLHIDDLLTQIMDAAADITNCESASVLLWNSNTRELVFTATTTDWAHDIIGKSVPLEGSIAGTIMQERRVVQVDDTSSDPRHYTGIQEDGNFVIRSLMGVPMTVKKRLIGVLEVVDKRELPWTDDDQQYLSALASQAAVAIENAQLITELKRANDELSQLDKLKSDFIAIASHELRTPLGIILGYASFLQDQKEPKTRQHAQKVMKSALKLRKITEDLTNLRHLQQNPKSLQLATLTVEQLLEDAHFDVLAMLDAKGQKLHVTPPPETLYVHIDRSRLVMALTNLLANAIEFTEENGHITMHAEPRSDEVWIHVTDKGIGIEAEQLDRIFDQFYQVENHLTRNHEGLGIGLSIAQALVEAHGGRIWATSDGLGAGSTFTIALPLASP